MTDHLGLVNDAPQIAPLLGCVNRFTEHRHGLAVFMESSSYLFDTLDPVREYSWEWLLSYNEERPDDSLGAHFNTHFPLVGVKIGNFFYVLTFIEDHKVKTPAWWHKNLLPVNF